MRLINLLAGLSTIVFSFSLSSQVLGQQTDGTISSGNWNLPFVESGDGVPIVAVHGAVSDHRIWKSYAETFSEKNRFLAYSRRFYGIEKWPDNEERYDHSDHAKDLTAVIQSRFSEPVHLVARSSGAYAAVIAAVKHPELVRSLSLWEPFVGSDLIPSIEVDDETQKAIGDWGSKWGPVVKEVHTKSLEEGVKKFIEHVYEMSPGEYEMLPETTRKIFRDNARTLPVLFGELANTTDKVTCDFLQRVDKPTLVLLGSETHPGFSIAHSATADCISNAKTIVVQGVNHNGAAKKPEEISELVRQFIREIE